MTTDQQTAPAEIADYLPTADGVTAERRGGVLVVTLNRPDQMNTFTVASENSYGDILEAADADPDVRVVVVAGAGRAFCAGADMADLQEVAKDAGVGANVHKRGRDFPRALRKPLIAAVDGAAAGLGMVHALYADVRFGGPKTVYATAFAQRGLAAEYGISWLLPRLVGHGNAMDLLLSGRKVRGEEAHRIGLVDQFVAEGDVLSAAVEYASEIAAQCSPEAMALIKQQVFDDEENTFEQAFGNADTLLRNRVASADFTEGVASYVERRAPRFAGLSANRG